MARLNLIGATNSLDKTHCLEGRSLDEPILITTNGTIISGFGDWHTAVGDARISVDCIEYPLGDEEALQFILARNQPRRGWNNFTRIRLALELAPYFQRKALANQCAGGKYKGLANLPEAERIDVRQEIASAAGVGGRNVGNVKTILQKAHPKLINALQ